MKTFKSMSIIIGIILLSFTRLAFGDTLKEITAEESIGPIQKVDSAFDVTEPDGDSIGSNADLREKLTALFYSRVLTEGRIVFDKSLLDGMGKILGISTKERNRLFFEALKVLSWGDDKNIKKPVRQKAILEYFGIGSKNAHILAAKDAISPDTASTIKALFRILGKNKEGVLGQWDLDLAFFANSRETLRVLQSLGVLSTYAEVDAAKNKDMKLLLGRWVLENQEKFLRMVRNTPWGVMIQIVCDYENIKEVRVLKEKYQLENKVTVVNKEYPNSLLAHMCLLYFLEPSERPQDVTIAKADSPIIGILIESPDNIANPVVIIATEGQTKGLLEGDSEKSTAIKTLMMQGKLSVITIDQELCKKQNLTEEEVISRLFPEQTKKRQTSTRFKKFEDLSNIDTFKAIATLVQQETPTLASNTMGNIRAVAKMLREGVDGEVIKISSGREFLDIAQMAIYAVNGSFSSSLGELKSLFKGSEEAWEFLVKETQPLLNIQEKTLTPSVIKKIAEGPNNVFLLDGQAITEQAYNTNFLNNLYMFGLLDTELLSGKRDSAGDYMHLSMSLPGSRNVPGTQNVNVVLYSEEAVRKDPAAFLEGIEENEQPVIVASDDTYKSLYTIGDGILKNKLESKEIMIATFSAGTKDAQEAYTALFSQGQYRIDFSRIRTTDELLSEKNKNLVTLLKRLV